MVKLIKRIPGWHLFISNLPGSASRKHVISLGKPPISISILEWCGGTQINFTGQILAPDSVVLKSQN